MGASLFFRKLKATRGQAFAAEKQASAFERRAALLIMRA
jgi:hypothetical protein